MLSAQSVPSKDHELFRRFPLAGRRQTSCGPLPTPYHIYGGHALFIGGAVDLTVTKQLLAAEQVTPIATADGRALMGIWIIEATEASLGAHHELQFSILVSRQPLPPVPPHPLAVLKLLAFDPDARILCHGLWNNTDTVVAYNREVLGLNARMMSGGIWRKGGSKTFSFNDSETGRRIFAGHVREMEKTPFTVVGSLMRLLGLRGFFSMLNLPYLASQVMNPVGTVIPHNAEAQAYIKNKREVLQFFDPAAESLEFGDSPYRDLKFQAQFLEHMRGFKFVYLNPYNAGESAL